MQLSYLVRLVRVKHHQGHAALGYKGYWIIRIKVKKHHGHAALGCKAYWVRHIRVNNHQGHAAGTEVLRIILKITDISSREILCLARIEGLEMLLEQ